MDTKKDDIVRKISNNGQLLIKIILCFALSVVFSLHHSSAVAAVDVVVAFGDSVTRGKGGVAPYPAHLQGLLGDCIIVINQGIGGEQTKSGVKRINNVLAAHQPNYILIMEGANDAYWGVSGSTVKFNLGSMIDKARNSGATPIISTITPNTSHSGFGGIIINDYNPKIRALAAEKAVTLVDSYQNVAADWSTLNIDGIHPNEAGAIRIAEGFGEALPCSGSGGGCFLATAAFGTALEPQVVLLKQFRDQYLLPNKPGQIFVRNYYQYSPPIADFIKKHDSLRLIVRVLLYPLIGFSYFMVEASLWVKLIFAAIIPAIILLFGVAVNRYRHKEKGFLY